MYAICPFNGTWATFDPQQHPTSFTLHLRLPPMATQLLHIPLRRTQAVPLGFNIAKYVETEFHQDQDQAAIDADSLDKLRNRTLDVQAHISFIDVLSEYVDVL